MGISQDLLNLLVCPLTKQKLQLLSRDLVLRLNGRISQGDVRSAGGTFVEFPADQVLITADRSRLYLVRESIPIMLVDKSIETSTIGEGWEK